MKSETVKITSNYDGLVLYGTVYEPDDEPKAIVQIIHSLFEHREYYDELARILCHYGYVVVVSDLRGHGDSVDLLHPLGHVDAKNGWMMNLVDTNRFSSMIREKYRRLPFFLLGHSMGSLVARSFLKRFEYEIDGVILTNCPYFDKKFYIIEKIEKLHLRLEGPNEPDTGFWTRYTSSFDKGFNEEETDRWMCSDMEFVRTYRKDPKSQALPTTSMVNDLLFGFRDVFVYEDWHPLKKKLPVLILGGQDDVCARGIDGVKQVHQRLRDVGYTNIQYCLYPEFRHNIFHEYQRQTVYGDIIRFLNSILETTNQ